MHSTMLLLDDRISDTISIISVDDIIDIEIDTEELSIVEGRRGGEHTLYDDTKQYISILIFDRIIKQKQFQKELFIFH